MLPKSVRHLFLDYLLKLEGDLTANEKSIKDIKLRNAALLKTKSTTALPNVSSLIESNVRLSEVMKNKIKSIQSMYFELNDLITEFDSIIIKTYSRGFTAGILVSIIVTIIIKML